MDSLDNLRADFLKAYDELADKLFRRCFFRISDREKAKDMVQEIFFKSWKHLASGKQVLNMKAFLYKVADNLIIDEYRRPKNTSLEELREKGFDRPSSDHEMILTQAEHSRVLEILERLPKNQKEIIIWRMVDGLLPKEISEMTGLSENVVSVRLNRAMKKLRSEMNIEDI